MLALCLTLSFGCKADKFATGTDPVFGEEHGEGGEGGAASGNHGGANEDDSGAQATGARSGGSEPNDDDSGNGAMGDHAGGEASGGNGVGGTNQAPTDADCSGTPKVVPPESDLLVNIGRNSYVIGPEGGMFDLTDEPSVTIVIAPCAVDEPVRFTYGVQREDPGLGGADGASVFISFLESPARLPGNSAFVSFHGDATMIWHDAQEPDRARVWAHGLIGYEELATTVDDSDVRASTPLVSYFGFALGE